MIRPAAASDVASLAELCGQLGYPVPVGELEPRLARLLALHTHVVYVEENGARRVVGWIHAAEREQLVTATRCEILGLVVDQGARRRGVGRRLVEAAEHWAVERGLEEVVVRSGVARAESHPFYLQLGFDHAKTQHVYRKRFASA